MQWFPYVLTTGTGHIILQILQSIMTRYTTPPQLEDEFGLQQPIQQTNIIAQPGSLTLSGVRGWLVVSVQLLEALVLRTRIAVGCQAVGGYLPIDLDRHLAIHRPGRGEGARG